MAYTQAAISGQPTKNKGGTILNAGNASASLINNLSLSTNGYRDGNIGSKIFLAVSPYSSGNLGTTKPISAGVFAQMEKGKYVGMIIGSRIAQTNNTTLQSGAADFAQNRDTRRVAPTYQRLHITSWNASTGAATFGANRGDTTTLSADHAVLHSTNAIPGELTYHTGSANPTNDDYKARTAN